MWKCPECGESLHDYEASCWNCRISKKAPPPPAAAHDAPPAGMHEAMKKCPFCAEEIRAEAIRCRYCGSDMPEVRKQEKPPAAAEKVPASADRKYVRIPRNALIAILILLAAIAAVWGAVLLYKPIYDRLSSKSASPEGSDKDISVKGVAYEEIMEYDGKGNVKKTLKTYPQEKGKSK